MAAVVVSFASCNSEAMRSDVHSIMAGYAGEKSSVLIHGMNSKAKILYSPEWVTVSIQDSLLCYEIQRNEMDEVLRDCILIEKGSSQICLPVIQGVENPYLSLSASEVVFDTCGGSQTIGVCTNSGKIVVDAFEDVNVDYTEGQLTLSVAPNKGGQKKGVVTVYAGEKASLVKVHIKGKFCSTCNGEGYITCPDCHGEGMVFVSRRAEYKGCKTCGGKGYQGRAYSPSFKQGTGKIICPDCNGNGVGK